MRTFALKRKRRARLARRFRSSRFGYSAPLVTAQRAQIRAILRSIGAQASLSIGQPNDKYEQEADRVANRVMAMPDPELRRQPNSEEEEETLRTKPLADQITPLLQRQDQSPEEEEETVQAKFKGGALIQRMCAECEQEIAQRQPAHSEEEEESLQAKSNKGASPTVARSVESQINQLEGGGQPLEPAVRRYFEPRFGYDFSHVRVHVGSSASAAAKLVNARAFTLGSDVVFGSAEYQPQSAAGKRLLGHELTHVVQQGSNGSQLNAMPLPVIQRECRHFPEHSDPDTYCETQAEAVERIANSCPPDRDDFLYRDGPAGFRWRPIPGYGCAHYVAHHLGITEGPAYANCRGGLSVTITQLITGRTEHAIADAQVDDIWVTASRGHCGYVTEVDPVRGVRARECYIGGGTGHRWHTDGSVFR